MKIMTYCSSSEVPESDPGALQREKKEEKQTLFVTGKTPQNLIIAPFSSHCFALGREVRSSSAFTGMLCTPLEDTQSALFAFRSMHHGNTVILAEMLHEPPGQLVLSANLQCYFHKLSSYITYYRDN